jgi:hypothetical protein
MPADSDTGVDMRVLALRGGPASAWAREAASAVVVSRGVVLAAAASTVAVAADAGNRNRPHKTMACPTG